MKLDAHEMTSYVLGELKDSEKKKLEKFLKENPQAREELKKTQEMAQRLEAHFASVQPADAFLTHRQKQEIIEATEKKSSPWSWKLLVPALPLALGLVFLIRPQQNSSPNPELMPYKFQEAKNEKSVLTSLAKKEQFGSAYGEKGYRKILGDKFFRFPKFSGESYQHLSENDFVLVANEPLSTFSMDANTASYANVRRFLVNSQLPPTDAVRVEEFINYFKYEGSKAPQDKPVNVHIEASDHPWHPQSTLVRVALRTKITQSSHSNLVFLVDVSGSMHDPSKLPLVKKSLSLLTDQLSREDRISIVTYSGYSQIILNSASGAEKSKIKSAIEKLNTDGGTNGSAGIMEAYRIAKENFIENGVNRVIMATDGDFNLGVSSDDELIKLIEEKRKTGVFLSILGFGSGDLQDGKMSQMATHGNGNYAYIDSLREANKVLIEQRKGTTQIVAKDVKAQVEFNPKFVYSYKLVGYEKGQLSSEDFTDDQKDAGDLGSDLNATALYEVVLTSNKTAQPPLKYQNKGRVIINDSNELLTVKIRFKLPQGDQSEQLEVPYTYAPQKFEATTSDFQFSSAVAGFATLLRGQKQKDNLSYEKVIEIAEKNVNHDEFRGEFIELVKKAKSLKDKPPAVDTEVFK